jgi:hypothetical protein
LEQSSSFTRNLNPTATLSSIVSRSPGLPRSYLWESQGQPQHLIFSPSDAGQTLPGSTHHHDGSTHDLTEQEEYENDESEPRRVPEEDDDGEGSTEHHANLVALAPSGKEITQLEDGRLVELERQLLETLVAKIGRDRRVAQMTDELALKSALLEQVETTAAEVKNHAELELRALQAKVDELLLSRDQAIEQAQSALQEATFRALLEQIETNVAEGKKSAGLEQRELQAKLDKLLLPRDQALEQARSALQKATFCTAEANERNQRELPEVHAKLEARESEWAAFRLRLADTEDGWAKSKSEADTSRAGTQAAAGLVNMDVDRVMTRLMERVRAVEAEMASLRGNGKSTGGRVACIKNYCLVLFITLVFIVLLVFVPFPCLFVAD